MAAQKIAEKLSLFGCNNSLLAVANVLGREDLVGGMSWPAPLTKAKIEL